MLLVAFMVGCREAGHASLPRLACAESTARIEDGRPVYRVSVSELLAQSSSCDGRLVSVDGFLLTTESTALVFESAERAEEEARLRSRGGGRSLLWLELRLVQVEPQRYQLLAFNGLRVRASGRASGYWDGGAALEPHRIDVLDPTDRRRDGFVERLRRSLPDAPFPPPPPFLPPPPPPRRPVR
jgi:hypothetical protein